MAAGGGEAAAGSFELQVEVEESPTGGQGPAGGQGSAAVGQGSAAVGQGCPTVTSLALRVTGDLHLGGLMLLIAESMGLQRDWSGHALWWEQRGCWLLRAGASLDALGVGAEARLRFAPRHRALQLLLPNACRLRLRLDCALPMALSLAQACGLLGLRHPEELSLLRPEEEQGGRGRGTPPEPDLDLSHLRPPCSEEGAWSGPLPPGSLQLLLAPRGGPGRAPPPRPPRGNPLLRRAELHGRWLDPSQPLLEQGVAEGAELELRFKFLCHQELDPERDGLRLALLCAQGLRSLLSEELECTEEEALLCAALQYRMQEAGGGQEELGGPGGAEVEDLETALNKLEAKLGGDSPSPPELQELEDVLELAEELEVYRPRRLPLLGSFRPCWVVLRGGSLCYGRSPPQGSQQGPPGDPPTELNLRGCGVSPEVDLGAQRFCIRLLVAGAEGMSELQLRCRDAPQYCRWVSGCRLASRGLPLGGAALAAEARVALGALGALGGPGETPSGAAPPDPRRLLPPRVLRKAKGKQLVPRILAELHRLGALSPAQAQLRFLEALRSLPGYGHALFLVRFRGCRRDELLALGPCRLLRLDAGSGAVSRAWRYSALRRWNINWDSQQVTLELAGEVTLGLRVLSAPCRVLHHFLGGFLCLGGARPGQPPDPKLLQRLAGGQDPF